MPCAVEARIEDVRADPAGQNCAVIELNASPAFARWQNPTDILARAEQ
jgi:hypothetical protein